MSAKSYLSSRAIPNASEEKIILNIKKNNAILTVWLAVFCITLGFTFYNTWFLFAELPIILIGKIHYDNVTILTQKIKTIQHIKSNEYRRNRRNGFNYSS